MVGGRKLPPAITLKKGPIHSWRRKFPTRAIQWGKEHILELLFAVTDLNVMSRWVGLLTVSGSQGDHLSVPNAQANHGLSQDIFDLPVHCEE